MPRNIESRSYMVISQHSRYPSSVETLDITKISVRIDCTAPDLMSTLLAILRKSRLLSHITRL